MEAQGVSDPPISLTLIVGSSLMDELTVAKALSLSFEDWRSSTALVDSLSPLLLCLWPPPTSWLISYASPLPLANVALALGRTGDSEEDAISDVGPAVALGASVAGMSLPSTLMAEGSLSGP